MKHERLGRLHWNINEVKIGWLAKGLMVSQVGSFGKMTPQDIHRTQNILPPSTTKPAHWALNMSSMSLEHELLSTWWNAQIARLQRCGKMFFDLRYFLICNQQEVDLLYPNGSMILHEPIVMVNIMQQLIKTPWMWHRHGAAYKCNDTFKWEYDHKIIWIRWMCGILLLA